MSISMKKLKAGLLAGAGACTLATILAACGGGGDHHHNPPPPPPEQGLRYDVIPLSLGGPNKSFYVSHRGINAKGQVAGATDVAGGREHAFLYDGAKMIDLGTMGGVSSDAPAINELGQVTGWANLSTQDDSSEAFFYDGTLHKLGTLGGTKTVGLDINDRSQITGDSTGTDGVRRAFLYQNGTLSPLSTPGIRSSGSVINNNGIVAGRYDDPHAFVRGFIVDACHCPKDLGTLGGDQTFVFAINDANQVAGASEVASKHFHAFRYENGVMTDLGTLGGDISLANSINAAGWVAGYATRSDGNTHAFVYDGKTMRDLGTLGGIYSAAEVINASGRVVGAAYTAHKEQHAMTWTEADGMVDLNTVLHNPPPGLLLINAFTVSDNGSIVAQANSGLVLLKPRSGG